jgi:archaellum component FlaC
MTDKEVFDEEIFNTEFVSDQEEIERIMKRAENISKEIGGIRKTCAEVVDEVKKIVNIIEKLKEDEVSK